jgi:hypothetical protein
MLSALHIKLEVAYLPLTEHTAIISCLLIERADSVSKVSYYVCLFVGCGTGPLSDTGRHSGK